MVASGVPFMNINTCPYSIYKHIKESTYKTRVAAEVNKLLPSSVFDYIHPKHYCINSSCRSCGKSSKRNTRPEGGLLLKLQLKRIMKAQLRTWC